MEKPQILDQLKAAAKITDAGLDHAKTLCVAGADVWTICQAVDAFLEKGLTEVYNSKKTKKVERGISFPTCVSLNNNMGHFSPLEGESCVIADGDVAKVITGCHIDGWATNASFTVVVGATGANACKGQKADLVVACHEAMLAAQRAIIPGGKNSDVTEAIARVCEEYKINPVEGVLSHKIMKYCIDSNDTIINKECVGQAVAEFEFAAGDVFGLDIYCSTGKGVPMESENRSTVFKRDINKQYMLKMKSSRAFFSEVEKRFPSMPFSIRQLNDITGAKVGVKECQDHDLINEYAVLCDKKDAFVAQFGATVAILPKSTTVLSGNMALDSAAYVPDNKVENEEVAALIKRDLWAKEDKKKK